MTDSQKLDLLIQNMASLGEDMSEVKEEISILKEDMSEVKKEISVLKEDMSKMEKEVSSLKEGMSKMETEIEGMRRYDVLILDEVERVHTILIGHMADESAHTA